MDNCPLKARRCRTACRTTAATSTKTTRPCLERCSSISFAVFYMLHATSPDCLSHDGRKSPVPVLHRSSVHGQRRFSADPRQQRVNGARPAWARLPASSNTGCETCLYELYLSNPLQEPQDTVDGAGAVGTRFSEADSAQPQRQPLQRQRCRPPGPGQLICSVNALNAGPRTVSWQEPRVLRAPLH